MEGNKDKGKIEGARSSGLGGSFLSDAVLELNLDALKISDYDEAMERIEKSDEKKLPLPAPGYTLEWDDNGTGFFIRNPKFPYFSLVVCPVNGCRHYTGGGILCPDHYPYHPSQEEEEPLAGPSRNALPSSSAGGAIQSSSARGAIQSSSAGGAMQSSSAGGAAARGATGKPEEIVLQPSNINFGTTTELKEIKRILLVAASDLLLDAGDDEEQRIERVKKYFGSEEGQFGLIVEDEFWLTNDNTANLRIMQCFTGKGEEICAWGSCYHVALGRDSLPRYCRTHQPDGGGTGGQSAGAGRFNSNYSILGLGEGLTSEDDPSSSGVATAGKSSAKSGKIRSPLRHLIVTAVHKRLVSDGMKNMCANWIKFFELVKEQGPTGWSVNVKDFKATFIVDNGFMYKHMSKAGKTVSYVKTCPVDYCFRSRVIQAYGRCKHHKDNRKKNKN